MSQIRKRDMIILTQYLKKCSDFERQDTNRILPSNKKHGEFAIIFLYQQESYLITEAHMPETTDNLLTIKKLSETDFRPESH